ncbi:MAG: phosphoribosyltransferase [Candidatus Verstraetearchaeota archaeon]|nr:phosphoribosyltransferase [Candidatus Verstraetearchaeota archaeon]
MPKINCKKVTWDEVEKWSQAVSDKIYASGWMPDVVVAISRGGYVPARLVCDRLVVGELVSLQISHWPSAAQMAKEAGVRTPLNCNLSGKKALIVDDIADTGDSLIIAKDHVWTNCRPDAIKIASLQWISGSSKIRPDYYAEEVKGWVWYQYPWSRLEDVIGFVRKVLEESPEVEKWSLEDIAGKVEEWYGVIFDRWFFERAVESLRSKGLLVMDEGSYFMRRVNNRWGV